MPRKRKVTEDNFYKPFPTNLRKLMETTKTTQQTLADVLGFQARQSIGAYMDGSSSPDFDTLIKICEYFNVSADWLLGLSDVQRPDTDLRAVSEYIELSPKAVEWFRSKNNYVLDCILSHSETADEFSKMLDRIGSASLSKGLAEALLKLQHKNDDADWKEQVLDEFDIKKILAGRCVEKIIDFIDEMDNPYTFL